MNEVSSNLKKKLFMVRLYGNLHNIHNFEKEILFVSVGLSILVLVFAK